MYLTDTIEDVMRACIRMAFTFKVAKGACRDKKLPATPQTPKAAKSTWVEMILARRTFAKS